MQIDEASCRISSIAPLVARSIVVRLEPFHIQWTKIFLRRLTGPTRRRQNAAHREMSTSPPPASGHDDRLASGSTDPPARKAEVRAAGRGGVAILGAKLYFVLIGLVQQI